METAGNNPKDFIRKAKGIGINIVHKCTSVRHALSAERNGVNAISIDGFECGGHPGEDDVGGLVLFAAAAKSVRIPLIASGGIGDGRGMAAALALGAEGINMGTRFCATQEAPIHDNIKQALVLANEAHTNLILRTFRNTSRVLKNAVSDEVVTMESRAGGEFEDVHHLVSGARGEQTLTPGDVDSGLVWASQVVGLIDDIPTCAQLIDRIINDCRNSLTAGLRAFA